MRRETCDVLIVGAGPAGAAAGVVLARAGLRVLAVDRATFPRPKTCGDALSNAALALIAELGAGPELSAAPHAVVHAGAAILPDGARIRRSYGARPGRIVGRLDLDDLLRRRMVAAGVHLLEGQAIRALERRGPAEILAFGPGFEGQARAVIAADGPGSVAWTALGVPYPRGAGLAVAATVYLRGAAPAEPDCAEHYFERDLPCGYGWLFPPVEGLANAGVYQRADHYQRRGAHVRELLRAFLARHPDRFAAAEPAGPVRTWALPLAARPWPLGGGPGILVCGDAGRSIDPLSGEGIFQALKTGMLAGEAAAAALAARGAVDAAALRRFRLACARAVHGPSLLKSAIQESLRLLVARGWDRSPAVQRALQWGYGSGRAEFSKAVPGA